MRFVLSAPMSRSPSILPAGFTTGDDLMRNFVYQGHRSVDGTSRRLHQVVGRICRRSSPSRTGRVPATISCRREVICCRLLIGCRRWRGRLMPADIKMPLQMPPGIQRRFTSLGAGPYAGPARGRVCSRRPVDYCRFYICRRVSIIWLHCREITLPAAAPLISPDFPVVRRRLR